MNTTESERSLKEVEKKSGEDLDHFLEYGKYQALRVWIFGSFLAFIGGVSFAHIFFMLSDPPDWSCQLPEVIACNKNITGRGSICEGGEVFFNTSHQNHIHSLLVENLWICNDQYMGPSILTATMIGAVFNNLLFGYLSDLYGRKLLFSVTNVLYIALRLIMYHLSEHYIAFVALGVLANSYFPVGVRIGYCLLSEICDEKGRRHNYIAGWVFWVAGTATIPFVAEWMGHWYPFGLFSILINVVFVIMHPFLPESPRWLLTVNKYKEAADLINHMRIQNKLEPIENLEEKLAQGSKTDDDESFKSIFTNKSILRILAIMSIIWSVNDYFYIAVSLNVENLAGNMFVNFSLLSLTELPAVFIGQFVIDRVGRRWVHCSCMVIATVPLMLCIMLVDTHDEIVVGLSIISKVASNVGWFVMWVQCVEIFPTSLRNTGITICGIVATVVTTTGPFVVDLGKIDQKYPFIVFSMFGIIGTIFTSIVPETKGNAIAETVNDMVRLVTEFKFLTWKTW